MKDAKPADKGAGVLPKVPATKHDRQGVMGLFSGKLGYDYGGNIKDRREAKRRPLGNQGWVRFGRSFAVRACRVLDTSNTGVRLHLDRSDGLTDEFILMATRGEGAGRRAKVKWRRGLQVGAEFC